MNEEPTVLVLGPGGAKGFLELGALLYLEQHKYLSKVRTVIGVSVGAVIGLLLVCGYSAEEILENCLQTTLFQDLSSVKLSEVSSHSGLIPNTVIREKLESLVQARFGIIPSLHQLYMATGYILEVVTVNLNTSNTVYFSAKTEPDCNSVEAVLLSMNIPLLFYKLEYKGNLYIDGAFGNPYPVDRYDDGKTNILGIHISTREKIEGNMDLLIYIHKIIDSPSCQLTKMIMDKSSKMCTHIRLSNKILDTTGVSLSLEDKVKMIVRGYNKTRKQLTRVDRIYVCKADEQEEVLYDSPSHEDLT